MSRDRSRTATKSKETRNTEDSDFEIAEVSDFEITDKR